MKRSILVTGVTGSGKSTTCKALLQVGYTAYDIESLPGLFSWRDDKTGEPVSRYYDDVELAKSSSWICDKRRLKKIITNEKADLAFYCGAASNMEDIWPLFDVVVVLRVSDATTVERLSRRNPSQYGHTKEVREYVLSWKHEVEKEWLEKGAFSVSAEGAVDDVVRRIVEVST